MKLPSIEIIHQDDEKGEYAQIFEEEYKVYLKQPDLPFDEKYLEYLNSAPAEKTHKGYFSIDKKGKMVDAVKAAKSEKAESTDQSAYDLF